MRTTLGTLACPFIFSLGLLSLAGCSKEDPPEDAFKPLLSASPELVLGQGGAKSAGFRRPPESLAEQIFSAAGEPDAFKLCAAERVEKKLGKRSRCRDEEDGSEEYKTCLLRSGYWKGNLRFQLDAVVLDLNHDDRKDYVVMPRACTGLIADNGSASVYLFLGKNEGSHELSVVRGASVRILQDRVRGANAIFTLAPHGATGEYGRIYTYQASRYALSACYFRRWEAGESPELSRYRKIDCPP